MVVTVQTKAVCLNASSGVASVLTIFVVVEGLAPLQTDDVPQWTAKQRCPIAHAQAVAPVDGCCAAIDLPGVPKTLTDACELLVHLCAQRLHAFRVQVAEAVGAAEVHQFPSVVVELRKQLGQWSLSRTKSNASLAHAQGFKLLAVAQIHQRVEVIGVLLVGPCVGSQSSDFVGQGT